MAPAVCCSQRAATAAAPVGGIKRPDMSIAESQPAVPKPKLRWFQFSLRTLLVVVTLCAIPCSWLAVKMQKAKREQEAAAAFKTLGGGVAWSAPSGPVWFRTLIGDDIFIHVELLDLGDTTVTDAELEYLMELSQLQTLTLWKTKVTDAGLQHLTGLSRLQELCLGRTMVTDTGLEHLEGLSQLKSLWLYDTYVTDSGVRKLQQTLPTCKIYR